MSNPYEPDQPEWPVTQRPDDPTPPPALGQPDPPPPTTPPASAAPPAPAVPMPAAPTPAAPTPAAPGYPVAPPTLPPAGWYPDPAAAGGQRYWDGAQWTVHAQPPPPPGYAPTAYATGYANQGNAAQGYAPQYAGYGTGYGGRAAQRRGVTFPEAIRLAFTRWSDYRGRSSRSEYWWFALAYIIVVIAVGFVLGLMFPGHFTASGRFVQSETASNLSLLFQLITIPIVLPLGIRRLHDTGRPWPWILIGLIPCVGWIVLIVLYCLDTELYDNRWGPPPQ